MMITCTKCKATKHSDNYSSHPQKTNGKQSWCKQCHGVHSFDVDRIMEKLQYEPTLAMEEADYDIF